MSEVPLQVRMIRYSFSVLFSRRMDLAAKNCSRARPDALPCGARARRHAHRPLAQGAAQLPQLLPFQLRAPAQRPVTS